MLYISLAVGAEPPSFAHWVRLTDGSLLVGRIESIDGEQLRISLQSEKEAIMSISRKNISSLIVIPPVDPVLADKLLAMLEKEKTETIRLTDGRTLSGRLRSFSKGMFRFDLSLGGDDELLLESQPIPWRRVRWIHCADKQKSATF